MTHFDQLKNFFRFSIRRNHTNVPTVTKRLPVQEIAFLIENECIPIKRREQAIMSFIFAGQHFCAIVRWSKEVSCLTNHGNGRNLSVQRISSSVEVPL